MALASYYFHSQQQHLLTDTIEQYGESISRLTAEQVASPLLNNDAISLQAIAQQTTDSMAISSLIIYDINNTILAQANSNHPENDTENSQHFTVSVISSNNIIGSVSTSITPKTYQKNLKHKPLLSIHIFLLIAITIISLFILWLIVTFTHKNNPRNVNGDIATLPPETTGTNEFNQNYLLKTDLITLTLGIDNIDILYQQLNGELRKQQFNTLQGYLKKVLSLYNGYILTNTEKHIVIAFADINHENLLKSIYSAILLTRLNKQAEDSIILLKALIQIPTVQSATDTEYNLYSLIDRLYKCEQLAIPIDSMSNKHNRKEELFIERRLFEKFTLSNKVSTKTISATDDIICILGVNEQYETLIENQLEQLK